MSASDVSMRVVADHSRSMTFLIADGVMPSNEFRGYVLRKIMRRAMRHGMKLGIAETFLHQIVDVIVREMGDAYPELRSNRDTVVSVVRNEEERFSAVLAGGLPRLEDAIERAAAAPGRQLPGEEAFKLYDTFGLPLDFIDDLAGERQVGVDRDAFDRAMEGQREKARAKSAFEGKKGQEFVFSSDQAQQGLSTAGDRFEGYTTTTVKGTPVIALFDGQRRQVSELRQGSEGYAALGQTPFYLEVRRAGFRRRCSSTPTRRAQSANVRGCHPNCRRHAAAAPHSTDARHAATSATSSRLKSMRRHAMRRAEITLPRTCSMRRCGRCLART